MRDLTVAEHRWLIAHHARALLEGDSTPILLQIIKSHVGAVRAEKARSKVRHSSE